MRRGLHLALLGLLRPPHPRPYARHRPGAHLDAQGGRHRPEGRGIVAVAAGHGLRAGVRERGGLDDLTILGAEAQSLQERKGVMIDAHAASLHAVQGPETFQGALGRLLLGDRQVVALETAGGDDVRAKGLQLLQRDVVPEQVVRRMQWNAELTGDLLGALVRRGLPVVRQRSFRF